MGDEVRNLGLRTRGQKGRLGRFRIEPDFTFPKQMANTVKFGLDPGEVREVARDQGGASVTQSMLRVGYVNAPVRRVISLSRLRST